MSFIVGTNDKGALITEKSVLMIKLLKKKHPNFTSYIKIKMGQRAFPVAQW